MTTTHSDDHLGTLRVESRPDLQTEIIGLSWAAARDAMGELALGRSPVITNTWGTVWVVNGLAYSAAAWEPDTAPGEGEAS